MTPLSTDTADPLDIAFQLQLHRVSHDWRYQNVHLPLRSHLPAAAYVMTDQQAKNPKNYKPCHCGRWKSGSAKQCRACLKASYCSFRPYVPPINNRCECGRMKLRTVDRCVECIHQSHFSERRKALSHGA